MRPLLVVLVVTACGPSPSTSASAAPPAARAEPEPAPVDAAPPTETTPECGDVDACLAAAKSLDASDPAAATEAFYGACIGGSVEGCEQAGLRWQKDLDPKADSPLNAKIIDAFDRSCTLGGGKHGCGNVGLAYFYGIRGVSVDVDKALQYMTKACDVDENKLVCRRLELYEKGEAKPGVLPQ